MADTVDTATPSPANDVDTPQGTAAPSPEDEAPGREDDAEEPQDEAEEPQDTPSLTELFEQLVRDLSDLTVSETQLEAARNMPDVRRTARQIAGTVVVSIAALTAFAFVNVAVMDGLSSVVPASLAALVLAAAWIVVGAVLLLGMGRARRWLLWIIVKAPPNDAMEELERERDAAGKAALRTLETLGPALAIQVALAAVPKPGDVAGDVASSVVEVGDNMLDASDEIIEVVAEQLPGGGAVSQVWDVALAPGRLGIKVATTVLRRGRPVESGGRVADREPGAPGG